MLNLNDRIVVEVNLIIDILQNVALQGSTVVGYWQRYLFGLCKYVESGARLGVGVM